MINGIKDNFLVRFHEKREGGKCARWEIAPTYADKLEMNKKYARDCNALIAGQGLFQVTSGDKTYAVDTNLQICGCKKWDITGVPCPMLVQIVHKYTSCTKPLRPDLQIRRNKHTENRSALEWQHGAGSSATGSARGATSSSTANSSPAAGRGAKTSGAAGRGATSSPAAGRGARSSSAAGRGATSSPAIGRGARSSAAAGRGASSSPVAGRGARSSTTAGRCGRRFNPPRSSAETSSSQPAKIGQRGQNT
nr:uncharacterized protein LOC109780097 [Aegilops tauschii subsp. strangulata]